MKMWCNHCGTEVTTSSTAAVTPCAHCGSTTRQSWKPQPFVFSSVQTTGSAEAS
jgi:Zn finger protein HypA/HybF involved in hydrogenase expression